MNIPNKLTCSRLVLAPIFFFIFFLPELFGTDSTLYIVFLIAIYFVMELTDLLDGKIARRDHLVTDLGKVLDPFADVICHLTFFTCLLVVGIMPVWAFIFIIWREFSQSFTRMLMMGKGKAMAANIFGKSKTVLYALSCLMGIVLRICIMASASADSIHVLSVICTVLFALAAFSSVMSFVIYLVQIKKGGYLNGMTC